MENTRTENKYLFFVRERVSDRLIGWSLVKDEAVENQPAGSVGEGDEMTEKPTREERQL